MLRERENLNAADEFCQKYDSVDLVAAIAKKDGQAALEFLARGAEFKQLSPDFDKLIAQANDIITEYAGKNYHLATLLTLADDKTLRYVKRKKTVIRIAKETLIIMDNLSHWAQTDPEKLMSALGSRAPQSKRAASLFLHNLDIISFYGHKKEFYARKAQEIATNNLPS